MARPTISMEDAKLHGMTRSNLNRPSRAKNSEAEPLPGGRPRMPEGLSESQQKKWKDIVRMLRRRKTVTPADGPAIELYVRIWAQWWRCCDYIDEHGPIVKEVRQSAGGGQPYAVDVPNPAIKLAASLAAQLESLLKEMGMTGVSRKKVEPVKSTQDKEPPVPGTVAWFKSQPKDLVVPSELPEIEEEKENGENNDATNPPGTVSA